MHMRHMHKQHMQLALPDTASNQYCVLFVLRLHAPVQSAGCSCSSCNEQQRRATKMMLQTWDAAHAALAPICIAQRTKCTSHSSNQAPNMLYSHHTVPMQGVQMHTSTHIVHRLHSSVQSSSSPPPSTPPAAAAAAAPALPTCSASSSSESVSDMAAACRCNSASPVSSSSSDG